MEVVIAILSLLWVIGILSLQRIDAIIDEFVKANAYYYSLDQDGAINQQQLSINTLLPKTALIRLVRLASTSEQRWDRGGLKKSLKFYRLADSIKYGFELLLIAVTVLLPLTYLIDFNRHFSWLTFADKDALLYLSLFFVVVASLLTQKVLARYSDELYPLKFNQSHS